MSNNPKPVTDNFADQLQALKTFRDWVDWIENFTKGFDDVLRKQQEERSQLLLALVAERNAHDETKAALAETTQKLNNSHNYVTEEWLTALGQSQLISGLDRVISGEAQSDPADFRKRLVTWFGRRVNAKPEEVIAIGRQLVEKDSKAAAQIAWSPDTPFRDDVDAVEVKITYPGLRFGKIVVEHARGNVVEVIYAAPRPVTNRVVELLENLVCSDPTLQADSSRLRALLNDLAPAEPRLFIHTIVEACAAGIPVRLKQFGTPISNHTKSLCIQLLIDSRGLREDIAEKAVDAWADVLSRKMLKMKN